MDIPDPKKFLGWRDLCRKLPSWLKVILLITIIVIAVICFYLHFFGPVPKLKEENAGLAVKLADAESDKSHLRDQIAGLEENLAETESDKSSLRDEKNKLQTENQLLKTIADPVKNMLEQLYPEMKTAVAIARLAEDVKTVHSLATRNVYKPLAAQNKKESLVS